MNYYGTLNSITIVNAEKAPLNKYVFEYGEDKVVRNIKTYAGIENLKQTLYIDYKK